MADKISSGIIGKGGAGNGASDRSLWGKRVVVVGGASGLGFGAVRAAADAGAEVVVASRRPVAVRDVVQSEEGQVKHKIVDVTDEAAVQAMFDEIGELDHLFITASPAAGSRAGSLSRTLRVRSSI